MVCDGHETTWSGGSPGKGNEGKLTGIKASAKSSEIVDFRNQMGIYVLYEPNFVPVYIGQAGNGNSKLFARLKMYRQNHLRDRWTHFSWFGFVGVGEDKKLLSPPDVTKKVGLTYTEALGEVEGVLIQVLEPRLNRQGPRWQRTADEYVQAGLEDDPDLLYGIYAKVEELQEQIAQLLSK